MRSLKDIANYVRWRANGRPQDTIPPSYGPWMAAFDHMQPPRRSVGTISVVCPVFDTSATVLSACVDSVVNQTYRSSDLILVDDGSTNPETLAALAGFTDHPAVHVVSMPSNRGIAAATNRGIESAEGSHVAFLDHDDLLRPDALAWAALGLESADAVYTDEDQISAEGDRIYPFMKPAWSPRLLLGMNYASHLTAIRRDLVLDLGGLDDAYEGAQDHDLLLRLSERRAAVSHVPKVVYHWRQSPTSVAGDIGAKPWALDSGRRAVGAALERRRIDADVVDTPGAGPYRFSLRFRAAPGTIAVVDGATGAEANRSVRASTADIVIINPGGRTLSPDEQIQLAGWLGDPQIVAAGPKILARDRTVREAGWVVADGEARAYGFGLADAAIPFLEVARETSAVGGGYVAVRRDQFLGAGGFDESLPLTHAGVRMSLRLGRDTGGACVVEPSVTVSLPDSEPWASKLASSASATYDPFVSPHKATDGVTIDPPPPPAERLARLLPRPGGGSLSPEAAHHG